MKEKIIKDFRDYLFQALGQVSEQREALEGTLRYLEQRRQYYIDKLDAIEDIESDEEKSDAFIKAITLLRDNK